MTISGSGFRVLVLGVLVSDIFGHVVRQAHGQIGLSFLLWNVFWILVDFGASVGERSLYASGQ